MFHPPKTQSTRRDSVSKQRSRASIACAGCRARRTRCIIGEGQQECDRCRRNGRPCVIRDDDERRRPVTKAKVDSLLKRIGTLESTINAAGIILPIDDESLQTTQHSAAIDIVPDQVGPPPPQVSPGALANSTPSSWTSNEDPHAPRLCDGVSNGSYAVGPEPGSLPESHSVTTKLRSNGTSSKERQGRSSVRSRYFGITTNYHIYSDVQHSRATATSDAQNERAQAFLATVPRETHDYLMEMFWKCYNTVVHVVHREAFERDRASGGDTYYSGFMHICLLALGLRYADKTRHLVDRLTSSSRVSSLHHEAKRLVEYELNIPGGIPSIQALLLLGDLECGVGNNNTGWLYAGMAMRLCFDLGLNRDPVHLNTSDLEYQVRRTILWGAVILDRFWGLFLGRPTTMKLNDLLVSHKDRPMYHCLPMGRECTLETEIYESLIGLMGIASRLTESEHCEYSSSDPNAYYFAAGLDSELRDWNQNLSHRLRWDPETLETAPVGYFILHQQYHTLFILLYRPFIPDVAESTTTSHSHDLSSSMIQQIARKTCFTHAVEIAKLFASYSRRFNVREQFVTGMQHAATAALALVESISTVAHQDQADALLHLQCLAEALNAKATSYFPAKVMAELIFTVIGEYRANRGQMTPHNAANAILALNGASQQTDGREVHPEYMTDGLNGSHMQTQSFGLSVMDTDMVGRQWVEGQAPIDPMLGGFQNGFDSEWQGIMDILAGAPATEY